MVSCFVVGCNSGYHSAKTHLFKAPIQVDRALWIKNIPKREIPFDFNKSRLCHLHLHESDLIKNNEFIEINGVKVKNPAQSRWTLKSNKNTSHPGNAIYGMNNDKVETFRRFVSILDKPGNTFASAVTLESLRVTIRSAIEILEFLFNLGFLHVLTNKLNQDCLEKFFGIIRSMGGNDDHPTILNFMQLFRLMSVYIPTRIIISGNISNCQDMPPTVFQFSEILKQQAKKVSEVHRARRIDIEDRVLETIIFEENLYPSALQDHDYSKSDIQEGILFYLAGYIVTKSKKFSDCQACMDSLKSKDCPVIPAAHITRLKCIGDLKFPSLELFDLLKCVEENIKCAFNSQNLVNDPVVDVIESLESRPTSIGCSSEHCILLTPRIITFYISLRCYFHCKIYNNEISTKKKQSKIDRKKVKLH